MSGGQFKRVGGDKHLAPSIYEAAQEVNIDISRLPASIEPRHYYAVPAIDGGRFNDAGRVYFHDDLRGGRAFNYKEGLKTVWRDDAGRRLTRVERRRFEAESLLRAAEAKAKLQAENELSAEVAREILNRSTPLVCELVDGEAPSASVRTPHPYLLRKGIKPARTMYETEASVINEVYAERGYRSAHGFYHIGFHDDGGWHPMQGRVLVMPLYREGRLRLVQCIDAAGHKHFLFKSHPGGCYWASGSNEKYASADFIGIAEGIATALSVEQVEGFPCIAAMSKNNLLSVAKYCKEKFPNKMIVILSDVGNGETEAREAAEAVRGECLLPPFDADLIDRFKAITGSEKPPKDWNDYYVARGDLIYAE